MQVQFWHHITKCTDCCFLSTIYDGFIVPIPFPLVHNKSSSYFSICIQSYHMYKKGLQAWQINDCNHRYLNQVWYDETADLCRTPIFDFPYIYIAIYLYHLFWTKMKKKTESVVFCFCYTHNWRRYLFQGKCFPLLWAGDYFKWFTKIKLILHTLHFIHSLKSCLSSFMPPAWSFWFWKPLNKRRVCWE